MDEFHEIVYTVQKEPEDNRRLNDGREEKQNFKRTDSNICILYSFWTVSGIDACRNGERSVQGGIWAGSDRSRCLSHSDLCSGKG